MAAKTIGLSTHIWNNNFRSVVLLALYPFILAAIVWGCAFAVNYTLFPEVRTAATYYMDPSATPESLVEPFRASRPVSAANAFVFHYWPAILAVVSLWFVVAWFANTKMVRMLSHSRPVTRTEEPELYNMVENLCIARGMKTPRLEIIETHARNAFASGVDERSYTVTVTRGLLNSLTRDEVEAVMAHELTHIINRDVRLLIVSIIFTGLIGFAAQMAWSGFRHSMWVPRHRGRGRGNQGGAVVVILAVMAVLWLGYMASLLTRFAISRRREYLADAGAVDMTKNPSALMSALMRIAQRDQIPETTADIAMMCTQNSKAFFGVFATHPPIEDRVRVIAQTTNTPVPELHPVPATKRERFGGSATDKNPWVTRQRRPG